MDFDLSSAKKIHIIFNYHNGLYGSPQIKFILNRTMQISWSKIARYMRILVLKSKIRVKKDLKNKMRLKNVIVVILILLIANEIFTKKINCEQLMLPI
ncbi:transposase [Spiroplasma endosymbiont of Aspidapion aeneum]|uniref:transposase n=1 Tax=Spiroplasma endosymbiont of Aspidapion aeneum TaxID=3066276 RepID=UPI003CC7A22E